MVVCHVPIGFGVHGCGVSTPNAAAVAEATAGLLIEVHIPIGVIFVLGSQSLIVAAGFPSIRTLCWFVVFNIPVPMPIVQTVVAPVTTISPIPVIPLPFLLLSIAGHYENLISDIAPCLPLCNAPDTQACLRYRPRAKDSVHLR